MFRASGRWRPAATRRRHRLAPRRAAAAGLPAAALIALAACSSGGGGPAGAPSTSLTPRQALLAAASHARQVTSASETLAVRDTGSQHTTTAGTIQFQRKPALQASETLNTTAAGKSTQIKVILTGTAIYLHEAALAGQLGKPWLKLDLSALNGTALASISQLVHSLQGNDFANQTQLLAQAKNVHSAGSQTIDGVATTEYAGSVRAAEALKALPASLRTAMAPELQMLGNGTISFHVWIDGQHHTRKITDVETVNGETINTTVNITAINQPVHVTIPPASQTATPPGA
jgi:LppX_LprAFG lipoprotein